ncbi:MAG TPA: hypothetical protein PLD25_26150 [Chloroflexota bacterium]|nr:hypothetical protein [Chloroflexota bacterium]HUM70604.1 hypothetical protein [Chloroflexota bacterium]
MTNYFTCKGHNLAFLPEVVRMETGHRKYNQIGWYAEAGKT